MINIITKIKGAPYRFDNFIEAVKFAMENIGYKCKIIDEKIYYHGGHIKGVVRVTRWEKNINITEMRKFAKFIKQETVQKKYNEFIFCTENGYSPAAIKAVSENKSFRKIVKLLILNNDKGLVDIYGNQYIKEKLIHIDPPNGDPKPIKIGAFMHKGGVGKSSISLLMAGMLSLKGNNVVLKDLDVNQSLSSLVGEEGLFIGSTNTSINVCHRYININGMIDKHTSVVYDFPPQEYDDVIKNTLTDGIDFLIMPVEMSAIAVNRDGSILEDTYDMIRKICEKVVIIPIINKYRKRKSKNYQRIMDEYTTTLLRLKKENSDSRLICLRPDKFHIPESDSILNLGGDWLGYYGTPILDIFSKNKKIKFSFEVLVKLTNKILNLLEDGRELNDQSVSI